MIKAALGEFFELFPNNPPRSPEIIITMHLAGDADELLCAVGGIIGSELPGRVPRKELFEAHAVARVVDRHFPEETEITEFCAGFAWGCLGYYYGYPRDISMLM